MSAEHGVRPSPEPSQSLSGARTPERVERSWTASLEEIARGLNIDLTGGTGLWKMEVLPRQGGTADELIVTVVYRPEEIRLLEGRRGWA